MNRPYTDITTSTSNNIQNGSIITSCTFHGNFNKLNTYVKDYPTITDIEQKYGNRFYNGIFVQLVGNQTVIGG